MLKVNLIRVNLLASAIVKQTNCNLCRLNESSNLEEKKLSGTCNKAKTIMSDNVGAHSFYA